MKKIYTLIAGIMLTTSIFAQAPEKMSYQAVVRDGSNNLVSSTSVGMQISIVQGTASGSAVYVETQTPTSNANGLISVEIGAGTVVSGTFGAIDWANGPYFIKTETDPTGGTSYTITGTSQLMSVPYAIHTKQASQLAVDTINAFTIKVNKGLHPFYAKSATHEMYNAVTQQIALVGTSQDNHDPIDTNDLRALLVHTDAIRHLTKTVVCEPGQLNISVQNDSIGALGQNPFQAVIKMDDVDKEILIGNAYDNPNQTNALVLGEDYSAFYFSDDDGVTSRMLGFFDQGFGLIENDTTELFTVGLDGTVNINDIINLKPRSSAPSTPVKGTMYFDDTSNTLMVFDGTVWQACW